MAPREFQCREISRPVRSERDRHSRWTPEDVNISKAFGILTGLLLQPSKPSRGQTLPSSRGDVQVSFYREAVVPHRHTRMPCKQIATCIAVLLRSELPLRTKEILERYTQQWYHTRITGYIDIRSAPRAWLPHCEACKQHV